MIARLAILAVLAFGIFHAITTRVDSIITNDNPTPQSLGIVALPGPSEPTDLTPWTDPVPGPDSAIATAASPWGADCCNGTVGTTTATTPQTSRTSHRAGYCVKTTFVQAHMTKRGTQVRGYWRKAYCVSAR